MALLNAGLVGMGGFLGSTLRYGLTRWVLHELPLSRFPFGTLCVNLIGCLLVGVLAGLADWRQGISPELRTFAAVGVLGGFTTFSAFGYETFALMRDGDGLRAAANVAVHIVVGTGCVWAGYAATAVR
jgi:CrcB protein